MNMLNKEEKSCGNCVNCDKTKNLGWICEEYGFYYVGVPVKVTPPHDKACDLWTDDPKKKNTWEKYV